MQNSTLPKQGKNASRKPSDLVEEVMNALFVFFEEFSLT